MSQHRKSKTNLSPVSFGGLKVISHSESSEVSFQFRYKSWPKLATRLVQRGHSVRVILENRRLRLETSAGDDELRGLVASRASTVRGKKALAIIPVLALLGFIAFSSMGDVPQVAEAKKPKIVDHCEKSELVKYLELETRPPHITEIDSMIVGGIEIGKFSCNEQRYSYTLDLAKTKRVLKLQKLNT
jgi:hypothetical protein